MSQQLITVTDALNTTTKQMCEKEGDEDESESCAALGKNLNSSQKTSNHYKLFLKVNVICVKRNVICEIL